MTFYVPEFWVGYILGFLTWPVLVIGWLVARLLTQKGREDNIDEEE